jgi:hypothetical protein
MCQPESSKTTQKLRKNAAGDIQTAHFIGQASAAPYIADGGVRGRLPSGLAAQCILRMRVRQ